MKHKHYDIGVAKLADTTLVKFVKLPSEWVATTTDEWNVASDYFLCLPQHKEACLHWLNGGDVEENYGSKWDDVGQHSWHDQSVFNFDDGYTIRIKPKKEKRWIAYSTNQKRLGCLTFDSEVEAKHHYIHEVDEPQFIEIEVELTSK